MRNKFLEANTVSVQGPITPANQTGLYRITDINHPIALKIWSMVSNPNWRGYKR